MSDQIEIIKRVSRILPRAKKPDNDAVRCAVTFERFDGNDYVIVEKNVFDRMLFESEEYRCLTLGEC